jgi:hypothetical protein
MHGPGSDIESAPFFHDPQFQSFYEAALRDRATLEGFYRVLRKPEYRSRVPTPSPPMQLGIPAESKTARVSGNF